MTDTFRALCAELLNSLKTLYKQSVTAPYNQTLEIGGVRHAIPIGIDILAQDCLLSDLITRAETALAQPEPEGPTNQEIEQWADATPDVPREALDPDSACWHRSFSSEKFCDTIRSALEYWCVTPQAQCSAIKPVPVSERLPGLKDCDTKGMCWFIDDDEKWCPVILGDILDEDEPDAIQRVICYYGYTHWIQGWALPVPTSQESPS